MPADEELDDQDEQQDHEDEQPDPLAELSDEDRARVEALATARAEALAAEHRKTLDEEFSAHKAKHQHRVTAARKNLVETFGVDLDDDGEIIYRDPSKLGKAALSLVGQEKPTAPDAEPAIDWDQPWEVVSEQINAVADHRADQKMAPVLAKLDAMTQQMQQFMGVASRPALQAAPELARQALDEMGIGHLADHQDFDAAFAAAVQKNVAPENWNDPDTLAELASLIGAGLHRRAPERKTARTATNRDAEQANVYRSSLGSLGSTRGNGRDDARRAEAQELREFNAIKEAFPGLRNLTLAEYRATQKDGADYGDFVAAGRSRNGSR